MPDTEIVGGVIETTSDVVSSVNQASGVSGVVESGAAEENVQELTAVVASASEVSGAVETEQELTGYGAPSEGNKSNFHNALTNRDLPDQHPISSITGLQEALDAKVDDMEVTEDGLVYLLSNGLAIKGPYGPFAGGGGGSSNNAKMSLKNTSGWLYKTIALGTECIVYANWSSTEDDIPTGDGTVKIMVGTQTRYTGTVKQGDISFDIAPYVTTGDNSVYLVVTDAYANERKLIFSLKVIELSLESTFDATVPYSGAIDYPYTPTGTVVKTMHFLIDGSEVDTAVVSETGYQQNYLIPAQSHGSHRFEVYFTAKVDEEDVKSNTLTYDLICLEEGNTTPIIASSFVPVTTEQFVTFTVPYIVYDPANLTATVEYRVNGEAITTLTVDRTEQKWSCRGDEVGEMTISIACGDTVKSFTLTITETTIDVSATTNNLALYLTAHGRSNNEDNPAVWEYGDISTSLTNFGWKADGWQLDEDGNTVLRLIGDARAYIPYQIFANDFRTTGKTIEIEFATRDVLNYDAVLLSCMSGGRGMEVTTQRAVLSSEQSSIGTQYKEEEHVRLTFVIEKKSSSTLLLLCYINGILSGSVQYPEDDDFSQADPVGITIGSNECTTDIYCIRVYDNDLARRQVLNNWIADTQVISQKKERYDRNKIYNDYGQVTIETLKKDLPYLVLFCPVLPQFKGDKKTCSGYYVDPLHPEKNFSFEGAEIDVQGTSSQYYYVKNYKIKYKGGFILTDGTTVEVYQLNDNVIPTNTYTYKADVASSEGANNVVLAKVYNDLCPVKTPPQEEDPRVRQTIDGHPIVIFWAASSDATPQFMGKYNFNHDKGTEEVFGFESGDESWEIRQNGTERVGWRSADFSGTDWQNDFEARYPEDNVDVTNLSALAEWLVSTDTNQATGETLVSAVTYDGVEYTTDTAEYREAKFRAELPDHADVDAMVFYYLITEIFLCIDQREKNAFPTLFVDMERWIMFFYDADSSLGIDNKGALAFDYYLEDIDYTDAGDPVFNGQASVLWVNLRKCYYAEITAEYQRLRTTVRSDGTGRPLLSYEVVDDLFESHQGKWSEAIYNEDGYKKSIEALIKTGAVMYLPMLQGKKEQQRKWWLYNRFRYLDSKYVTGSSMSTRIIIRARSQANVTLVAYVNMYGHVYYNAEMVEHRMFRGQPYEFEWAASGAEDPVIGINDADRLTSIGDLAPLQVETIDVSPAVRLTELKVGDESPDYVNDKLSSITLGNNTLLRKIDFRNCVKLAIAVDASGCTGLEEVYFDGTAITGLSLTNGGRVKVLHIPDTMANITILNQMAIEDFTCPGFTNVSTLRIENSSAVIDSVKIVSDMKVTADTKPRVRLIGLNWILNSTEVMDKLLTMRGMTETGEATSLPVLSGTVHFAMAVPTSKLMEYEESFPFLTITADSITADVLMVPGAVLMDSEGDILTMSNGGYQTEYTADQIDAFTTAVLEALASIE